VLAGIRGKRRFEKRIVAVVELQPAGKDGHAYFRVGRDFGDGVEQLGDFLESGYIPVGGAHAAGVVDDEDDGRGRPGRAGLDLDVLGADGDGRFQPNHVLGHVQGSGPQSARAFRENKIANLIAMRIHGKRGGADS
jgi:hypothetical protein